MTQESTNNEVEGIWAQIRRRIGLRGFAVRQAFIRPADPDEVSADQDVFNALEVDRTGPWKRNGDRPYNLPDKWYQSTLSLRIREWVTKGGEDKLVTTGVIFLDHESRSGFDDDVLREMLLTAMSLVRF